MRYRPGQTVPSSGIYQELNALGQKITEVTCVKGESFPPTKLTGMQYELIREAKHSSER